MPVGGGGLGTQGHDPGLGRSGPQEAYPAATNLVLGLANRQDSPCLPRQPLWLFWFTPAHAFCKHSGGALPSGICSWPWGPQSRPSTCHWLVMDAVYPISSFSHPSFPIHFHIHLPS